MARDAEAKKIRLWADSGDRQSPEQLGLERDKGWPVSYEQLGSGDEPERVVFNQLLRELTGALIDRARMGIYQWDEQVNYVHPAFVVGDNGKIFVSITDSGPLYGNAADPTQSTSRNIWRVY